MGVRVQGLRGTSGCEESLQGLRLGFLGLRLIGVGV